MRRLMDFIYYNIFVYVIYMVIDFVFDFLNFYSSHKLGKDIMIMPTTSDMVFIGINVVASLVVGLIVLNKLKALRDGTL